MTDPFGDMPVEDRKKIIREIGQKAKDTFEKLKADSDNQLQYLEPIHCMCLSAYYMVFSVSRQDDGSYGKFGQHQAELLQALLLRHPVDFYKADVGTPQQVQTAIDLASNLMEERGNSHLADIPEDSSTHARARVIQGMRMYTQVMRGEYYPEQLKRLFRPSLVRIDEFFIKAHGISPTTVFDLVEKLALGIQDRLNAHVKKVSSFIRESTFFRCREGV